MLSDGSLNGTSAVPSHTTHSGKLLSTAEHALGLGQPCVIRTSFHFPLPKDLTHPLGDVHSLPFLSIPRHSFIFMSAGCLTRCHGAAHPLLGLDIL